MSKLRYAFFSVLSMMFFVSSAFAQTGGAATADTRGSLLSGAFAVGIAALGCGLADGRAIAAACEGTARNPAAGGRIFTMLILGLALIETLVILTFAAAFLGL